MRPGASFVAAFVLLVAAIPPASPCGFDPCGPDARLGDDAQPAVHLVRAGDWRWQRLQELLRAYLGEETARSALPTAVPRDAVDYAAAAAAFLQQRGLAVPEQALLPAPVTGYWFDPRCARNTGAAAAAFLAAIDADPRLLPHAPRLVAWRAQVLGLCEGEPDVEAFLATLRAAAAETPALGDATTYLAAITEFYKGRPKASLALFEALAASSNPWLRETALYMRGRAHLVAAQEDWDGWSRFEKIDRAEVDAAAVAFHDYLAAYPAGRHADSARGMARRIAWLRGEGAALNRLAVADFARRLAARDFEGVGRVSFTELTNFVALDAFTVEDFPFDVPLAAATFVVRTPALHARPADALARLARARAHYEPYPGLYELVALPLLASANRPEALELTVPKGTPPAVRDGFLFDRAVLLGRGGDSPGARRALRALVASQPALRREHLFVGTLLAEHLRANEWADAFEENSPFLVPEVAADVFGRLPDAALEALHAQALKSPAPARDLAAPPLLFRRLRARRYGAFLAEYERAGKPAPFAEVESAARTLAQRPGEAQALFAAGSFLHTRDATEPPGCALRFVPRELAPEVDPGDAPLAYYVEALRALEQAPDAALEPRLLHHAIFCFKQTHAAYACRRGRHPEIHEATRARWFRRLKSAYPSSTWARKTPYYY